MADQGHLTGRLAQLLTLQRLAVLATTGAAGPHASLVAFAATGDFRRIIFPTRRDTLKFRNLEADPRVALLIDDSANDPDDLSLAAAATIRGTAREAAGVERRRAAQIHAARHPSLKSFVDSPECALFIVEIASARLAEGFADTGGRPAP